MDIMESQFDIYNDKFYANNFKFSNYVEMCGYEKKDKDVIPMWVADMDFKICQPIQEQFTEMTQNFQNQKLTNEQMQTESKQSIINWVQKRHQMNIQQEEILFTQNTVNSYLLTLKSISKENDKFLILTPTYHMISITGNLINRKPVESELNVDASGNFMINFEDIESKIQNDEIKCLVICNPNNPTGRAWKKDELVKLGEICQKYDKYIISDDIFADYVYKDFTYNNVANVVNPEFKKKFITCYAPSKVFNTSGVGIAFIICHDQQLRNKIVREQLKSGQSQQITQLSYYIYKGAYSSEGEKWVKEMNDFVQKNAELLVEKFSQENIKQYLQVIKQEGTYLLLVKYIGMDNQEMMEKVLKPQKLVVQNMEPFYFPVRKGIQEIRFNIGLTKEQLNIACDRFIQGFLSVIQNKNQ